MYCIPQKEERVYVIGGHTDNTSPVQHLYIQLLSATALSLTDAITHLTFTGTHTKIAYHTSSLVVGDSK